MNIGEQINNLRKQHGLSQDDLQIYLMFPDRLFLIGRMVKLSDLEMIIKVSDYFKISIDELLKMMFRL